MNPEATGARAPALGPTLMIFLGSVHTSSFGQTQKWEHRKRTKNVCYMEAPLASLHGRDLGIEPIVLRPAADGSLNHRSLTHLADQ